MAVRSSAVVGVSISRCVLRHIPGFGVRGVDCSFSCLQVKQLLAILLCNRLHNMKMGLARLCRDGDSQDPIQFEERKGLL